MSREEKINKMIEEIKIRRNDEQYRGEPFPIYHIEFDILNEEIERLNNIINELEKKLLELRLTDVDGKTIVYRLLDKLQELKEVDKE